MTLSNMASFWKPEFNVCLCKEQVRRRLYWIDSIIEFITESISQLFAEVNQDYVTVTLEPTNSFSSLNFSITGIQIGQRKSSTCFGWDNLFKGLGGASSEGICSGFSPIPSRSIIVRGWNIGNTTTFKMSGGLSKPV